MPCARCGHERPYHEDKRRARLGLRCGCAEYMGEEASAAMKELRLRIVLTMLTAARETSTI
jgi:hypothetical protein